jgi:predicted ferric reductase
MTVGSAIATARHVERVGDELDECLVRRAVDRVDDPAVVGLLSADLLKKYLPSEFQSYQYFVCGPKPVMDITEGVQIVNEGIEFRNSIS